MTLESTRIQPFPDERTVIVTGAGAERGMGRKVARKLVSEGWSMVAVDLDSGAVDAFATKLSAELPAGSTQMVLGVRILNTSSITALDGGGAAPSPWVEP